MIAGSVLFCRILQKNKGYYYKANHFVSVSSMVYRMKRNGAGLASICILATMVLVMISSTAALYFGTEDTFNDRYPRDINVDFGFVSAADMADEKLDIIRNDIRSVADTYGVTPENVTDYRCAAIAGMIQGNEIETDVTKVNDFNLGTFSDVYQFFIVPLRDYNTTMGTNETLEEGEALVYTYRAEYHEDTISFIGGASFDIKKHVDEYFENGAVDMSIIPSMVLIVPDFDSAIEGIDEFVEFSGNKMLQLHWKYEFDTGADKEKQIALGEELRNTFRNLEINGERNYFSNYMEIREVQKDEYYGLYGGLFYLGIILSIVFVFATVLIIYYKQISEGYEDQSRFEIMQKVGMTKKEIRKSINSQILTVFFLPLAHKPGFTLLLHFRLFRNYC